MMKPAFTEQIIRDIESLSEDKKHQVVAFIQALKAAPMQAAVDPEVVKQRQQILKDMDKIAKKIGENWQESLSATELVSSMRR